MNTTRRKSGVRLAVMATLAARSESSTLLPQKTPGLISNRSPKPALLGMPYGTATVGGGMFKFPDDAKVGFSRKDI